MSDGGPKMNGPASPGEKYIDTIDPDDPEYQRQMRRPPEVKEDLNQMENRSRVSLVLSSEAFREELEQIVEEQLKSGTHPASLIALQQISDLLLPHARVGMGAIGRNLSPIIPINDLRGVESLNYNKAEKILRCKLASLYRLVDMFGWTHSIYNHISVRLSQDKEHFLINPFGLLYSEVTASSLVNVDIQGQINDPGSTTLGINKAGYTLHSAIHQARPDIKCVIHLHTSAVVAVSAMKCGLLHISQESLICGDVSYHDYNGILIDQEEKDQLARSLGPSNKVMLLRNHGAVACGAYLEEAFHYAFNLMKACESQVTAISFGVDSLIQVDNETRKKAFMVANQGGGGVSENRKWRVGELEFEAHMRQLDNAGFRTGYVYKNPILKQEKKNRSNSAVEVPPSSSSYTYVFDGDYEHSKYVSPIKSALERQKQTFKSKWLASPNTYKKQEIEEIGTDHPKKYTKWVPEEEHPGYTSTPIKIESPNVFAPQGENPKEFKEAQKRIKKDYYEDKVTPGPKSKVLEGLSWEDAEQAIKDGTLSGTSDQVIVVGAASKGIIQRQHQHNAVVYKSYYAANPFEGVTEEDLNQYKKEVFHEPGEEPAPEDLTTSADEQAQNAKTSEDGPPEGRVDEVNLSPTKSPATDRVIQELQAKNLERSRLDQPRDEDIAVDEKPGSPAKSDTLRSTDSASGGETLEERSSKEGSPTKETPTTSKDKKKKKKFRMPSFSKKKNKESKESAI